MATRFGQDLFVGIGVGAWLGLGIECVPVLNRPTGRVPWLATLGDFARLDRNERRAATATGVMVKGHHGKNDGIVTEKKDIDGIILHHRVGSSIFIAMVNKDFQAQLEKFRKTGELPSNTRPVDMCMTDDVFVGRLGMRASNAELEAAFGSAKKPDVMHQILKDGEWKSEDHAPPQGATTQFETDFRSR